MKRATTVAAVVLLVVILFGCGGGAPPMPKVVQPMPVAQKPVRECKLGEEIVSGDLLIKITQLWNGPLIGRRYGNDRNLTVLTANLAVKNTSKGKIAEWKGWHGYAPATDEFGNVLQCFDMGGFVITSDNYVGDAGVHRIDPGQMYTNSLYWDRAPATSRLITFDVPLDGDILRFKIPLPERK